MNDRLLTPAHHRRAIGAAIPVLVVLFFALVFAVKWGASLLIDYSWWKELGQAQTWIDLYTYSTLPIAIGTIFCFAALLIAHARGVRFAGGRASDYPIYSRVSALVLLVLSFLVADASIDSWTVLRFFGSRSISGSGSFHDPIFGKSATFYLFDLPFWNDLRGFLFAVIILSIIVFWLTARGWQLRFQIPDLSRGVDISFFRLPGGLESRFLRIAAVVFLVALAFRFYLGRFEMVWNQHRFMVGVDYTNAHYSLPLTWLVIAALAAGCVLVLSRRWMTAGVIVGASFVLLWFVPGIASGLFVRPNEISLERPYIHSHIEATRAAYGLNTRLREIETHTNPAAAIDIRQHQPLLDNVRLWDWRPFHDTVTQMQALRPYYTFHDTDVDRYNINGQYKQVLLSPREIDISQLPGNQSNWINPHFIYTHGYGVVLAEVSKITPEGQPVYMVEDMPPVSSAPALKISQPDLYYGEVSQDPVFVDTAQAEFDYPQGADNATSHYQGHGGFPISSLLMRTAAALDYGDANMVLTNYLTDHSRMMIHRRIRERLSTLAPYLQWDADPYLVITPEGRLVWICDGYTTSDAYPFSREMQSDSLGEINYVRNAVKATVDAYDGDVHMYVFDKEDPIIASYRSLFPALYEDASRMPVGLRAHTRYPEELFAAQSDIYRIYHMRNPQSFYNNEDIWELSKYVSGPNASPDFVKPTYVFATLPGEDKPEFMLMTTFTPLSKENLIGVMLARCDGGHLGEIVVMQLSKQELILGPMQVNARISQDQNISKDLTLWNQQGSQVLRGQTLVLPVGDTFLYVTPIYLQAEQARMPQLKKVVLAVGNRLIYADTYEEAVAMLGNAEAAPANGPPAVQTTSLTTPAAAASAAPAGGRPDPRIGSIRQHLARYKEFASQGKWAEAGRELDAIQSEVQ